MLHVDVMRDITQLICLSMLLSALSQTLIVKTFQEIVESGSAQNGEYLYFMHWAFFPLYGTEEFIQYKQFG